MAARWQELAWTIDRSSLEVVSGALFDLGSLGLQEDHPPGQAPVPRQPWDTGPLPVPSAQVLLRGWWPEDADCQDAVAALFRIDELRKSGIGAQLLGARLRQHDSRFC